MKALVLLLWISTLITEAASPVMKAVRQQAPGQLKALLDGGADPNEVQPDGVGPSPAALREMPFLLSI